MYRILIVDDQADLRRLIRWAMEMLEKPAELHEATNGVAALALAQTVRPHLIVLDIMMPGELNGLEVCRRIKSSTDLADTKIILLSAKGQATDLKEGEAAGADMYMIKPFSPKRLLDAAEPLLGLKP